MRTSLGLLFTLLILGNVYGQKEKIKGNKIVSTERIDLESFHTIEIHEGFEVTLDESNDNQVKIEADSNLQEAIQLEVIDSVLTITSDKDIRRAKALNIEIYYTSKLKKISLYDKVNIKSLSPVNTSELIVNANDNTEVFLTVDTDKINCIANGKSVIGLHVTANEAIYQINENAELKGIITADTLKVDLYQKASAKLEGEVKTMIVRADSDTDFYGEKLNTTTTSLLAEGDSDCYILTNQEINIEAKDKAEIYLLGEPQIHIKSFTNEAILYKKDIDYSPSRFKLN
ncbi:GIN domain-containing protein [Aquimarina muelleri]|uniref:GIN domain-containing protein n=1 Tax=Aquimarina muelleri TaxID=279356 RepID=UPI003F688E17